MEDYGSDAIMSSDGFIYIAGYSNSANRGNPSLWIIKTDSSGNVIWQKAIGYHYRTPIKLLETWDGDIALLCYQRNTKINEHYLGLLLLDKDGRELFYEYRSAERSSDCGNIICRNQKGDIAFTGFVKHDSTTGSDVCLYIRKSNGKVLFNKYEAEWTNKSSAICPTSDGGYLIAGETGRIYSKKMYEILLYKINEDGILKWEKVFGTENDDTIIDVADTGDGGYLLLSKSSNNKSRSVKWVLWKIDKFGNPSWQKPFTIEGDHTKLYEFFKLNSDTYRIVGLTAVHSDSGYTYINDIDNEGNVKKIVKLVDKEYNVFTSPINDGSVYAVGSLGTLDNDLPKDIFLKKYNELGQPDWQRTYDRTEEIDAEKMFMEETLPKRFMLSYLECSGTKSDSVFHLKISPTVSGDTIYHLDYLRINLRVSRNEIVEKNSGRNKKAYLDIRLFLARKDTRNVTPTYSEQLVIENGDSLNFDLIQFIPGTDPEWYREYSEWAEQNQKISNFNIFPYSGEWSLYAVLADDESHRIVAVDSVDFCIIPEISDCPYLGWGVLELDSDSEFSKKDAGLLPHFSQFLPINPFCATNDINIVSPSDNYILFASEDKSCDLYLEKFSGWYSKGVHSISLSELDKSIGNMIIKMKLRCNNFVQYFSIILLR